MEKTIKILHLEDLPSDAIFVKNALKKSSIVFSVLTVDNREKFISALTEFLPDIILSDHSLPSFNSSEALEIIKQSQLNIPFIIVTATMSDEAAVELIMKGADDYILKDRLSRLPIAISGALEKFRLKRQHQFFLDTVIKSEKRYRAMIEHSADGIVILDSKGKPTYASASVKNVLGYAPSEILNMDLFTLMHPDDITDMDVMLKKILSQPGETMQGHTGRMLHKDGSWRWIEATITNLLNDPVINGIIDNFRDITEKKQAQDAIIENEHKFRSLVENSKDGMAILSATGKPTYISPSIINVLGYTVPEGLEVDLFSLAHHEDTPQLIEVMEQAMANPGIPIRGKATRMKHKNGEWRWIEGVVTNMLHDPAINGFVDNFRDVTQKRVSDQAIADSEEKYRLLFETSMDGILLTLQTGQILEANQAVCDIFQMTHDEIIAAGRSGLVDVTDPRLDILLEERSRTGRTVGEMYFIRKDGSRFTAEISSTIFENSFGNEKTSMVIRDATDRKRAEQLLRKSEQFNKDILASLSTHIGVIDNTGTIIAVNKAWDDFGRINGATVLARTAQGSNYFDVCKKEIHKGDLVTKKAFEGVLSVFNLDSQEFEMEYQCESLNEKRWFILHVMKFGQDNTKVVLSHNDVTELKNAGQKLEMSEFGLKEAQAIAKIGSWEMDLRTFRLTWSEQTYQIFETSANNFTPTRQSFLSMVHPSDRIKVDSALNNSIKSVFLNRIVHRVVTANGAHKTVEERWSVKNENGRPVKLIGTCQDITEKNVLERLLAKATTLARIGSYEADLASNFVFWSPMTKQIHEVGNDFIPDIKSGLNFYKKGLSREMITKAFHEAGKNQAPFDLELQIITAKGNERWVRVIGEAELIGERCIIHGSFQDIDKIKKAESEVIKAYQEKNIILESIGDAFFAIDKNWVINYWNKEAARLWQQPKSTVLNENLWDVFPESVGSKSYKKYHQAVKSGQIVHFEDYYPHLEKWLEMSAYPSTNGLSVFFRDITERKISEKRLKELNTSLQDYTNELVRSNKELEQFSYMVSHNLRAPVANIIGLGGLLGDETYPTTLRQEFLNGILENVKRLDEVIIDLNLVLQVKRQISEKNETVNLQDLVDNIQSSIQGLVDRENVQIITNFREANEFKTLKTYLHSIFYNLILNSIKYHQPDLTPVIEISTRVSNGKLTIVFKDNGMGFDLNRHEGQIFGLYKRFHHHIEGKGMGLFMVKTQVEMLGGTVSVTSKINHGTTFQIEFRF